MAYRRLHGHLDANQAVIDSLQNDISDISSLFGDSAGAEPDNRKLGARHRRDLDLCNTVGGVGTLG